jgi:uncharacterized protein YbcI
MSETRTAGSILAAASDALVALHKEQFGRGPTTARSNFAGPDVLVTVFYDALLPAEKALVEMGETLRVLEARAFFQEATRDRFIQTIEQIVLRKIHSFHSTCDPRTGIVVEIAIFEPRDSAEDGDDALAAERTGGLTSS